jgi:hypothetical protein
MKANKFDPFTWLTQKSVSVMAGLAIVELFALLSLDKLDGSLNIALLLLSIAIPALAGYVFMSEGVKTAGRSYPESNMIDLVASTGIGFSYLTLACIFWHFSILATFAFVSASMLMIVFVVYHVGRASGSIPDRDSDD